MKWRDYLANGFHGAVNGRYYIQKIKPTGACH
jgi:hypothetical protein